MKSSADEPDDSENFAPLVMPVPLDPVQQQIALLEAMVAGYRNAGYLKDVEIKFTPNQAGSFDTTISGAITPEHVDKLARAMNLKLHDPDKPSRRLKAHVDGKPMVDWLDSERERRDESRETDAGSSPPIPF